jgi:uncharacterized phage protein gp47/JayE
MPYSRPTLAELVNRVRSDVISRLAQDEVLRRADAEVYARVLAGVTHGLYGFIDWLSRQVIYDTAEGEILERWASIWGVTRKPAAAATGTVTLTGLAGAVVPAGSPLQALDGVQYLTVAEVTFTTTSAVVSVAASVPAAASNRATGQTLTLVNPVPGVQPAGGASALVGGADEETDDAHPPDRSHPDPAARRIERRLPCLGAGGSGRHPRLVLPAGTGPRHGDGALHARRRQRQRHP